jgi:hypothetical protein
MSTLIKELFPTPDCPTNATVSPSKRSDKAEIALLVLNKSDLLTENDPILTLLEEYKTLGYEVMIID